MSPVLRLPVAEPAILQVTSTDVIHAYAIVPMRIQQDAIPGSDVPMWFRPLKELETNVICAQLCGEGHGNMVGRMEVISKGAYASWAGEQSTAAYERNSKKAGTGDEVEEEDSGEPAGESAPAAEPEAAAGESN